MTVAALGRVDTLPRAWWAIALRSLAAVAFGLVVLVPPVVTPMVLVPVFSVWALVDGFLAIIAAARGGASPFGGVACIMVGIFVFAWPGLTEVALLDVIVPWALITGVFEIVVASRVRVLHPDVGWLGAKGVVSMIFAVVTMLPPVGSAFPIAWLIGVYAIVLGGMLLSVALQLRRVGAWPAARRLV